MFGFCSCFCPKDKSISEEVTFQEHQVSHYSISISSPLRSCSSFISETSKSPSYSQPETATDTSSQPFLADPSRFSSSICPLYFPSRDPLLPSSDIVSANNSNFELILDLESDSDWEIKQEKSFAYIMTRTGNGTHPNIAMVKAFFDLELDAEPEMLYNVLYDPIIRKKWDQGVSEYIEIDKIRDDVVQYYMLNKAPWPFADRDFVENRYIRKRTNGDLEILYKSTENNEFLPNEGKVIRGETIIGGQVFRKRISPNTGKPSLMITTICQADLKGEIPKKLMKITLPSSLLRWFTNIKKQLGLALQQKNQAES